MTAATEDLRSICIHLSSIKSINKLLPPTADLVRWYGWPQTGMTDSILYYSPLVWLTHISITDSHWCDWLTDSTLVWLTPYRCDWLHTGVTDSKLVWLTPHCVTDSTLDTSRTYPSLKRLTPHLQYWRQPVRTDPTFTGPTPHLQDWIDIYRTDTSLTGPTVHWKDWPATGGIDKTLTGLTPIVTGLIPHWQDCHQTDRAVSPNLLWPHTDSTDTTMKTPLCLWQLILMCA